MNRKSLIISLKGTTLSRDESSLIFNEKPWGVILFKRNIKSIKQLVELTTKIRKLLRDPCYPILVDEEGGRVSRFSRIFDTSGFSQRYFGKFFENDKFIGENLYKEYLNSICNILNKTGVNINTIPVLDVIHKKAHKIIGNRSYSNHLKTIISLGNICIDFLRSKKIGSVSKHIPGHGYSSFDTHHKKSVVNHSLEKLLNKDFSTFKNNKSNFVMTAHIIYKKIDPTNPATHSEILIDRIIRKKLNFKGLIISDDISMKALGKNIIVNAHKAIRSGCNLALYCGGNIKESSVLLKNMKKIDSFTTKKTSQFYTFLR